LRGFSPQSVNMISGHDPKTLTDLCTAITKNGITRLAAPPAPDMEKLVTENKITDEEILSILERPIAKSTGSKKKKPKKKKTAAKKEEEDEESSGDE
jgi:hypothetical protein